MDVTQRIVASARGWVGTRFHHQGRLKKTATHAGGVDCLGLLMGVAAELQLRSKSGILLQACDNAAYPHYPDGAELRLQLESVLHSASLEHMQPGDIALMEIDGTARHLGIISAMRLDGETRVGIIHAYAQARRVVEHALDEHWRAKIVQVFKVPVG